MFDVTLSPASPHTVKVDFETTSGGTATEGVDYWPHVYTHVIPYGETTTQMGFALIEDAVNAAGETVMVRLSNAREFDAYGNVIRVLNIAAAEATGTITAPSTTTTNVPGLTIRIQDATGSEDSGWLLFKVKLSKAYDDYVCYDFETISGGTATEGTDYLKIPKATYWMQIGKRVDKPFVRIIDDSVNDNGETVKVKISNARLCDDASQTLEITRAEATGTITETSVGYGQWTTEMETTPCWPVWVTSPPRRRPRPCSEWMRSPAISSPRWTSWVTGTGPMTWATCSPGGRAAGGTKCAVADPPRPPAPDLCRRLRQCRQQDEVAEPRPGGGEATAPGGAPAETWAGVRNAYHSSAQRARVGSDAPPAGVVRPSAARLVGSGHWFWVLSSAS